MNFTFSKLGSFGALGNQMWQIASTLGIAEAISAYARFPKWGYQPYFSISEQYFINNIPTECDLSGNYLQDYMYFSHIKEFILECFSPSIKSINLIKTQFPFNLEEYTAVHVRRANNLQLPDHHPVQTVEYFQQALDIMQPEKVIVFSDDITWCKEQSCFAGAEFSAGNDSNINIYDLTGANPLTLESAVIDLLAMSYCGNHIISNSTFSWWAAFLADTDRVHLNLREVIFPKNWYGPLVSADATLMTGGLGWSGI